MVRLFLALWFVFSLAGESSALTATVDKRARVTLTTPTSGSTFAWYVDDVLITTTATGSYVHQRPNRNYKYYSAVDGSVSYSGSFSNYYNAGNKSPNGYAKKSTTVGNSLSFTFTGNEFGVLLTKLSAGVDPATYVETYIDGVSQGQTIADGGASASDTTHSHIDIGKSGLSNTSHTVQIILRSQAGAAGLIFDGYYASNYSKPLGQSRTYKVIINGTTTETIAVSPSVDRAAVVNDWCDKLLAWINAGTSGWNNFGDLTELHGALANAYYLTGRNDIKTAADAVYTQYMAVATANGLLYNTGVNSYHIVYNGRLGFSFYQAYKHFGDAKYLTALDRVTGYFLNTWPKSTVTVGGASKTVWQYKAEGGAPPYPDGNQWAGAVLSCALAYNEPNSDYYHNTALAQLIKDNIDYAFLNWNSTTGAFWYLDTDDKRPQGVYGHFQFDCLKGACDILGYRSADITKAAQYLAGLGQAEPFLWEDPEYDWTPNPEAIIWKTSPLQHTGTSISSEMVDIAYSAATAGPRFKYNPVGENDATWTGNILYGATVFWAARAAYFAGVPKSVWAYDTASPAAKSTATMRASFR